MQLAHDIRAMALRGTTANAQCRRDLARGKPLHHAAGDLCLAGRESLELLNIHARVVTLCIRMGAAFHAVCDLGQKALGRDRFAQKAGRAESHRFDGQWNRGIAGREQRANAQPTPADRLLKRKAVHAGQANIDDRATIAGGFGVIEKPLGTAEATRPIAGARNQTFHRLTYGGVVIND